MRLAPLAIAGGLSLFAFNVPATTGANGTLRMRVVDVGAGQCIVTEIPSSEGKKYFVYDAGNFKDRGSTAMEAIRDVVEGETIHLLVLSHSDADHLAAVPEICDEYDVEMIIRGGMKRPTQTWKNADAAIALEEEDGCFVVNLSENEWPPGSTMRLGDALLTTICGFGTPPTGWDLQGKSERRNAGSIVMRLFFEGKSILICGDAVGRHIGDPVSAVIATERFMLDMAEVVTIDSDVLIAAHHGADNGSSTAFIEEVSPEWVIFSAGHAHKHPRRSAAKRFLEHGVELEKIFRTDRGDDEGDLEWDHQREAGTVDKAGDDHVEITINATGRLRVKQ